MFFKVVVVAAVVAIAVAHYVPVVREIHHPQPYAFGYSVKDHHGEQHREESGDGHGVKGSYGFTDARGIHRQVNYVADHAGFRAQIKTNEPGTANQDPAAVKVISSAHGGYAPITSGGYGIGVGSAGIVGGLGGYGNAYSGYLHGGSISGYDSRYGAY
ncbi:adult-specific rigid cuticular protein 15.7-like [Stegodyphus dumicola]|uniref:adult-specific rigid cuticular protein 15.7-like n=1 Tax=Stegodyphus dumicola TaxID=202533 RepID=UPI0015B1AAB2|nr:adult-specific rigid cuticular protein 15.7-like [Stegodyphus dumicola]